MEEIRNIDSVYSVSSEGRFFKNGKEKKGHIDNKGYVVVCMNGKIYLLHRLVAFAFPEICGEWFEGAQVDHINTVRDDCRATNLRFVSPKENCNNPLTRMHNSEAQKGENNPLYGKHRSEETKKKIAQANSKPVLQFSKDGNFIRKWESAAEVERVLGYTAGNIRHCCKNRVRTAYSFVWKYKEVV